MKFRVKSLFGAYGIPVLTRTLIGLSLVWTCSAATLVRSPYLQSVRSDSATILWSAREARAGEVRIWRAGDLVAAFPAQVQQFSNFFQYSAELRGLTPGREYDYQVLLDGVVVRDRMRFRTTGPGPFNFLVFGDSGTGNENQAALARRMMERENPSLVLHTGDLSQESGTYEQLDATYFDVYAPLMSRSPFFPSPGNHDYYTDDGIPCHSAHAPPPAADVPSEDAGRYYSFEWGNVHFVSLNSNMLENPARAARMLEWLDRDLARQSRFWKIVYFHHTPFPTGHHLTDAICNAAREKITPILERHNVHLVLTGHEHSYQRTHPLRNGVPVESGSGTVYVTTGGGGGVLHRINPSAIHEKQVSAHHYLRVQVFGARLSVTAIDAEGRAIDQFTLAPPAPASAEAAVNAASYTSDLAGGSLVTIFGRSLAREEQAAPQFPLPTELAGTSVTLNGQALPLLYVSPFQVNAQLPYGVGGSATLRVQTPHSSDELTVMVGRSAPAIIETSAGHLRVPAAVRYRGGSLITPEAPASAGDWVTLYVVGLGEVDGAVAPGDAAPGRPPLRAVEPVEVRIGERIVPPVFAGLSPGFAGLYQVNFRIPEGTPYGPMPLRVASHGARSEPVVLHIGAEAVSGQQSRGPSQR